MGGILVQWFFPIVFPRSASMFSTLGFVWNACHPCGSNGAMNQLVQVCQTWEETQTSCFGSWKKADLEMWTWLHQFYLSQGFGAWGCFKWQELASLINITVPATIKSLHILTCITHAFENWQLGRNLNHSPESCNKWREVYPSSGRERLKVSKLHQFSRKISMYSYWLLGSKRYWT